MKKKFLTKFFTIVAACGLTVGLASCGGDTSDTTSTIETTTDSEDGTSDISSSDETSKETSSEDTSKETSSDDSSDDESSPEESSTPDSSYDDSTSSEPEHVHSLTHVDAVAAKCTEDGNIEYWYCTECGKYYSDSEATTEITLTDTVVAATGHSWNTTNIAWNWSGYTAATATFICDNDSDHTQSLEATITSEVTTAATCTAGGVLTYTAAVTFEGVEYTNMVTESTDATGHDWDTSNIVWNWNGYESATATVTCLNDNNHTQTIDATITSEVTAAATCEAAGVKIYTATVSIDGTNYESKQTETIAALGHDWDTENIAWAWTEYASATATFTCKNDLNHTQTVEATITSEVASEATCETEGTTIYTATVIFNDLTYTDAKTQTTPATGHQHIVHVDAVAATCTTDGNIECWQCEDCAKYFYDATGTTEISETDVVISATGHSYGADDLCTICGAERATEGLTYTYDSTTESYSVSGIGTATDTEIYIPSTYDNGTDGSHLVATIGSKAFQNNTTITSVKIPSSVTKIETYAFDACSALTSINIPDSVTSIGDYGFRKCSAATTLSLGNGIKEVCQYAFSYCNGLTSISIPDNVTTIGSSAFRYCNVLATVVVGNGVETIGNFAFGGNPLLSSVTMSATNSTTWGTYVFQNDTALTSFTIPAGVEEIGANCFAGCSALTSITFETTAGWHISAKSTAVDLISMDVTDATTNVTYFTDTYVTYYWFWQDPNAAKSLAYNYDETTESYSVTGVGNISDAEIVIPSTYDDGTHGEHAVTSIGSKAFQGSTIITSITIPDSVTSIDTYVFDACSKLTSISLGNGLTSIGGWSFRNCTSLESIVIPDSVASLGTFVFDGCSALTNVSMPNGITSIGNDSFRNCTSLESIVIPDNVASLGTYVFDGCSALTSVSMPNGITSIGNYSFRKCTSLASLTLPSGLKSIGTYTFYGCTSLTSITIPANVTSIGSNSFTNCSALTSIAFEVTDGWYISKSASGSSPSDIVVTDMCQNVTYFTDTYKAYYWFRTVSE